MNIRILQLIEGARQARGLTVVIDVFRAYSLEAYLLHRGAEKIIPEKICDKDEVGVVNGLAYTELGGSLLKVEVASMPGTGATAQSSAISGAA